jgi:GMP synthase-like glutamine amidotransferase
MESQLLAPGMNTQLLAGHCSNNIGNADILAQNGATVAGTRYGQQLLAGHCSNNIGNSDILAQNGATVAGTRYGQQLLAGHFLL